MTGPPQQSPIPPEIDPVFHRQRPRANPPGHRITSQQVSILNVGGQVLLFGTSKKHRRQPPSVTSSQSHDDGNGGRSDYNSTPSLPPSPLSPPPHRARRLPQLRPRAASHRPSLLIEASISLCLLFPLLLFIYFLASKPSTEERLQCPSHFAPISERAEIYDSEPPALFFRKLHFPNLSFPRQDQSWGVSPEQVRSLHQHLARVNTSTSQLIRFEVTVATSVLQPPLFLSSELPVLTYQLSHLPPSHETFVMATCLLSDTTSFYLDYLTLDGKSTFTLIAFKSKLMSIVSQWDLLRVFFRQFELQSRLKYEDWTKSASYINTLRSSHPFIRTEQENQHRRRIRIWKWNKLTVEYVISEFRSAIKRIDIALNVLSGQRDAIVPFGLPFGNHTVSQDAVLVTLESHFQSLQIIIKALEDALDPPNYKRMEWVGGSDCPFQFVTDFSAVGPAAYADKIK